MNLLELTGVLIEGCELLDAHAIRAVIAHDKLGLREAPMLLKEFHGSPASVEEETWTGQDLARHHAYLSALQTKPGYHGVTTDTCVPISHLAEIINESVGEAQGSGLDHFILGHVQEQAQRRVSGGRARGPSTPWACAPP